MFLSRRPGLTAWSAVLCFCGRGLQRNREPECALDPVAARRRRIRDHVEPLVAALVLGDQGEQRADKRVLEVR